MKFNKAITASTDGTNILGTFEGELLDTNITNKNGLDITREVMEVVFDSEDYKEGIENGWFIGYLGHPEDPGCQEFEKGCIVMTDGYIDDDGKVYGTFNLIDTPVGRIVKTFQEAGVTFGISIRGAGDIIGSEVDPQSFVFRGFDLVAFPAYPESIPTFREIAASTNLQDQRRYKAVCASVKNNINSISSISTLETIQSQFSKKSDTYKMIDSRKRELKHSSNHSVSASSDIYTQKISAMTDLYLQAMDKVKSLESALQKEKDKTQAIKAASKREISSVKRIMGSQLDDTLEQLDKVESSNNRLSKKTKILSSDIRTSKSSVETYRRKVDVLSSENEKLKKKISILSSKLDKANQSIEDCESVICDYEEQLDRLQKHNETMKHTTTGLQNKVSKMSAENRTHIEEKERLCSANDRLCASNDRLKRRVSKMNENIQSSNQETARYRKTVSSAKDTIAKQERDLSEQDRTITNLKSKLKQSTVAGTKAKSTASDLESENSELKRQLKDCQSRLDEYETDVETYRDSLYDYQDAYASMYASALGVDAKKLQLRDNTTVSDIRKQVDSATNTANMPSTVTLEPLVVSEHYPYDDDLITL